MSSNAKCFSINVENYYFPTAAKLSKKREMTNKLTENMKPAGGFCL